MKKHFVEEGFSAAIVRKKRVTPPREIQFGGEFEAKLLALACSPAPKGRSRWTVRLLAEEMNTASLYEAFQPEEARRLAERLEIHYTPKHGSWLNIAEIDSVFLRGNARDNRQAKVDWQFMAKDARIKLKRLYPKL